MAEHVATVMDASKASDAKLLHDPSPGDHIVQFYEDESFLLENVARFLGAGLIAGEPIVVIATPEHRQALQEVLQSKGFALDKVPATFLDARETMATFMSGDLPDWARFKKSIEAALPPDGTRARLFGEMVNLLWRDGKESAAIRLEQLWNDIGKLHTFSLLCAYVMGNFYKEAHGAPFRDICGTHNHVLPGEAYWNAADAGRLLEVTLLQQRAKALENELQRRRELEEELRYAREQSEDANRAKDEFLAMLGHELRNPLSPILTALELMKLRGDGRTSREHEIIDRQARHLLRLVDDLLDVSKITRGKVDLRKQDVEVREVLTKATEIATPVLEQRRHHFEVDAPPRGLRVMADEARLAQVVANLLTNAAKYTEPGGHIRLSARNQGGELVIQVIDDGMGIAPDLLPRVFDLFVQGPQSSERGVGGLGLGLALVRNLVTLHGGTVKAQSDGPGKGSTFTVRLPALESATEVAAPPAAAGGLNVHRAARSRRILVVDDNEDALEMLRELLVSAGHEVRTANSGPSALQVVEQFKPEIALLDIGLPAMDGYELGSRLRALMGPQALCLMALTGYGQESDRVRSEAAGFALHLVKPLETTQLLETIARH